MSSGGGTHKRLLASMFHVGTKLEVRTKLGVQLKRAVLIHILCSLYKRTPITFEIVIPILSADQSIAKAVRQVASGVSPLAY